MASSKRLLRRRTAWRWLKPRSVIELVLAGFLLVMLPLLAGLWVTGQQVDRLGMESERTVDRAVRIAQESRNLVSGLEAMERAARQYRILLDDEAQQRYVDVRDELRGAAERISGLMQQDGTGGRIDALLATLERIDSELLAGSPGEAWPGLVALGFLEMHESAAEIRLLGELEISEEVAAMQERGQETARPRTTPPAMPMIR
jgi:hypothetical protein